MIVNLTKSEWEIIEHRLTLSDCLADCLTDNESPKWTWEHVDAVASVIYRDLNSTRTFNADHLDELQKSILIDCIEGSTFFANYSDAVACGERTKGQFLSHCKAAHSLIAKFESAGFDIGELPPEWP